MATQADGFGEGPMDQQLLARYSALFLGYELGGDEALESLRVRIRQEISPLGADLRPDAAHLLLIMADQMFLRPYSAPMRNDELPPHDREWVAANLRTALEEILLELNFMSPKRPRSAHAILRAIDKAWPRLAVSFGWA